MPHHPYRDDRSWSKDIIRAFRADMNKTHPIYNLRLYNMLGKVKKHITEDYVLGKRVRDKDPKIVSVDNIPISEFADRAWDRAMDMIMSFESAFRITWDADERDILNKIKDGMFIEDRSTPGSSKQIPFMLAYTNDAKAEFAQYELLWQKIRQKLIRYGAAYVN